MLVLSRKTEEGIRIGDEIVITVLAIRGGTVRLGIEAPRGVSIWRGELYDQARGSHAEDEAQDATSYDHRSAAHDAGPGAYLKGRINGRTDGIV